MENSKSVKKIITSILIGVLCLGGAIATILALTLKTNTNSYTTSTLTTSNAVFVDEIWDSTNKKFSKDNAVALLETISSDGSGKIDIIESDLGSDNVKTASEIFTQKSSKSIVVTLGGIKWIVTYLCKDTNGNVVATLYQADHSSTTSWFAGNTSSEGYDSGSNTSTPSNMYSRSYIRAVTLNAGSTYYDYGGYYGSNSSATKTATQSSTHEYALFTMSSFGLTQHLVQPKYISYQVNAQDPTIVGWTYYNNNDSLSTGSNYGSWNYATNSGTSAVYAEWGNDYLWLPSIIETGYSGTSGIWQINQNERSASNNYAWVRSA